MKPITEHERQALIGAAKVLIEYDFVKDNRINILAEIALASLTAEPIAVTDISEIDDLKNEGWVGNFLAPEFQGVDSEDRVYLYTAPPVPVIKLPEEIDNWSNSATKVMGSIAFCGDSKSFTVGANWMLSEIKRINGIK